MLRRKSPREEWAYLLGEDGKCLTDVRKKAKVFDCHSFSPRKMKHLHFEKNRANAK